MAKKTRENLNALLSKAVGKEDFTVDELRATLREKGISEHGTRRLSNAYTRFKGSGRNAFIGQEGYNVYGDSGNKYDVSSRTSGNKKGSDPGDIIGLGKHMSRLAGFASNYLNSDPEITHTNDNISSNRNSSSNLIFADPAEAFTSSNSTSGKKGTKKGAPVKKQEGSPTPMVNQRFEDAFAKFKEGNNPHRFKGVVPGTKSKERIAKEIHDAIGPYAMATRGSSDISHDDLSNMAFESYLKDLTSGNSMSPADYGKAFGEQTVGEGRGAMENSIGTTAGTAANLLLLRGLGKGVLNKGKSAIDWLGRRGKIKFPSYNTPGYAPEGLPNPELQGLRKGGKILSRGGEINPLFPQQENGYYLPGSFGEHSSTGVQDNSQDAAFGFNDEFGFGDPNAYGNNLNGQKALETGAGIAKYVIPFLATGIANKQVHQRKIEPHLAEFDYGQVYDMPRPNFGLGYRDPVGPDVLSETLGQKFGDYAQRQGEAQFENQNAVSRIQQRGEIVDRQNQAKSYNLGVRGNADYWNARMGNQTDFFKAGNTLDAFTGVQHMLASDVAQNAALKSEQESQWAYNVLKNPELVGGTDSAEYKRAYSVMTQGLNKRKAGSKFKSKFSN